MNVLRSCTPAATRIGRPGRRIACFREARPSSGAMVNTVKASVTGSVTSNPISVGEKPDVKAVLFDMDGVLCNSEDTSRRAACEVFKVLYGLDVTEEEFIPFMGMGEAYFLGGVANKHGIAFDVDAAKAKFFEVYINKYAKPGAGIGFPGAVQLVGACRDAGLKVAVASSADRVKVDANLAAAGFSTSAFDVVVSADLFECLKPAPDIFLAAAAELRTPTINCIVIEDAAAGVQAARAAGMRCIGVTTTLSREDMLLQQPDLICPDISAVRLQDIAHLVYTVSLPAK